MFVKITGIPGILWIIQDFWNILPVRARSIAEKVGENGDAVIDRLMYLGRPI